MILHQFLFNLKGFALMDIVILLTFNSRAPCRTLIGWGGGGHSTPPPPIISVPIRVRGVIFVVQVPCLIMNFRPFISQSQF